ncbi:Ff.00g135430.m01.CDS01 [Fusarium sp. VM40]|nr:Ff.00g135430.m01.CDS01 [Fusarium sp. VM40]
MTRNIFDNADTDLQTVNSRRSLVGDGDDQVLTRYCQDSNALEWRVEFLHQAVKDFLQLPSYSEKLRKCLLGWTEHIDIVPDNGNILHLRLVDTFLGVPPDKRHEWPTVPVCMDVTMQHAYGSMEPPAQDSQWVFKLLGQIERVISKDPKCDWGFQDKSWKTTFLAYAVANNMHRFVSRALGLGGGYEVYKEGRPLLHYTAWAPGRFPNRAMAKRLHEANAQINRTFDEENDKKTAIESLQFNNIDGDGQSHIDFISFLINNGAEVSRRMPAEKMVESTERNFVTDYLSTAGISSQSRFRLEKGWRRLKSARNPLGSNTQTSGAPWSTVLHHVAMMPVSVEKRVELLKHVPGQLLNRPDSRGATAFDMFLLSHPDDAVMGTPEYITDRHILEVVKHGARVTNLFVVARMADKTVRRIASSQPLNNKAYYEHKAWSVIRRQIRDDR